MVYTELTKKAMRIAFDAHKDQVDRTGVPYIFHPFHLAEQMDTEDEVIVALLHDVVEDTDMTLDDLRAAGFSERVINAVGLLTHDDSEAYMDYVRKIKIDPLAIKVKLADLRHNSDASRLGSVDEKTTVRLEKYKSAERLLIEH